MAAKNVLDVDEFLHLAIEASNKGDDEKSITLLKQALEIEPENAKILYMLGAMHAQIGMYERAIQDMQKAVAADPKLDSAHFQLGLLFITSGDAVNAEAAWSALDKLGDKNYLYLFKRGILALAANEFSNCIKDLEKGIELNQANMPLNKDMRMLIEQAKAAMKDDDSNGRDQDSGHVFISAYSQEEN